MRILMVVSFVLTLPLLAQYEERPAAPNPELDRGLELLNSGDRIKMLNAIDIFVRVAEQAELAHDCKGQSNALFYLALAAQDAGGTVAMDNAVFGGVFSIWGPGNPNDNASAFDDDPSSGLWEEARKAYECAAELDPTSGAALNNLAMLESADGLYEEALMHLAAAMEINPARRPFYLVNKGKVLMKLKDPEGAIAAYAEASRLQPDNAEAEQLLLAQLVTTEPYFIPLILWQSLDDGFVNRAQDEALKLVDLRLPESVQRELMGIVAVSLARQNPAQNAFHASETKKRLQQLAALPDFSAADGARDLLSLYSYDGLSKVRHGWWSMRFQTTPPALDSMSAFVTLARTRGRYAANAGFLYDAEPMLRTAVELTEGRDADSIIDLATIYFKWKVAARIDDLLREYRDVMFDHDAATDYRLHVALGTMYASLGRWGDEKEPASARYQLEQARALSGESLPLDARVVDLLATGYARTDRGRAADFRLDWARKYVSEGRMLSAQKVLGPLASELATLPDEQRKEYERTYEASQ